MLDLTGLLGLPAVQTGDPCYQLVRRAYKQWYGLELTDYAVPVDWDQTGMNLILDHYADEGFEVFHGPIKQIREGDLLVTQVGATVPNHIGIFIGGDKPILHQAYNRRSERCSFTGSWRSRVCAHLRHPKVPAPVLNKPVVRLYDLLTKAQKEKLLAAGVLPPDDQ